MVACRKRPGRGVGAFGGDGGTTGLGTDAVELPLGGLGGVLGSCASCRGGVAGVGAGAGGCRTWGASGASSARLLQEQPIAAATTPARRPGRQHLGAGQHPGLMLV